MNSMTKETFLRRLASINKAAAEMERLAEEKYASNMTALMVEAGAIAAGVPASVFKVMIEGQRYGVEQIMSGVEDDLGKGIPREWNADDLRSAVVAALEDLKRNLPF